MTVGNSSAEDWQIESNFITADLAEFYWFMYCYLLKLTFNHWTSSVLNSFPGVFLMAKNLHNCCTNRVTSGESGNRCWMEGWILGFLLLVSSKVNVLQVENVNKGSKAHVPQVNPLHCDRSTGTSIYPVCTCSNNRYVRTHDDTLSRSLIRNTSWRTGVCPAIG